MAEKDRAQWVLRIAAVAAFAVVPWTGLAGAAVMLLLLPLASECFHAQNDSATPSLMAVGCATACWQIMPEAAKIAVAVWCFCTLGLVWLPVKNAVNRGFAWAAVCALTAATLGGCLAAHYGGPVSGGLAVDLANVVGSSAKAPSILLNAYQYGYARLEGKLAKMPALYAGDQIVMQPEVFQQLMFSIRTTLEETMASLLPELVVYWLAATAVLCSAIPDWLRSRSAGWSDLPRFENWHIGRGWGLAIGLMALGYGVPYLTGATVAVSFGRMCGAAFCAAYGLQGMAVMWAAAKLTHRSPKGQLVWMIVIMIIFPLAFVIYGAADQVMDMRHLRRTPEE